MITQPPIFLERFVDDGFELGGKLRVQTHRRQRRLVQDRVEQRRRRRPLERLRAGAHLVEDHAKGKQIGARVERLPERLLRRHVRNRAERRARAGQVALRRGRRRRGQGGFGRRLEVRQHLRQTEVEHLGVTAPGHEDVGRLDVAMDDARSVRGVERVGNLDPKLDQLFERHRPVADPVFQRLAFEKLHRDEPLPAVLADLVNRADVRMVQRRRGARLAHEAVGRGAIAGQLIGQELQRDVTAKQKVLGAIDDAHSAAAEHLENAIVRDSLADHRFATAAYTVSARCPAGPCARARTRVPV